MPTFLLHALIAGTAVALAAGLVGYFVVLRAQVFAGDALSHAAFTGSLAALAAGVDLRLGLFAATVAGGLALGGLGRRGRADDVVIGNTLSWILGLGVFFLTLYATQRSTDNGSAGVSVLFGSIFGISASQAVLACVIGLVMAAAMCALARPLLFASVDPIAAGARGLPVRGLGAVFLAVLGVTAAEASQVVGSLLLLGLLAAPAGAAVRLTARPYVGFLLAGGLAVLDVWLGLAGAYVFDALPPSFTIITAATLTILVAWAWSRSRPDSGARPGPASSWAPQDRAATP